MEFVKQNKLYVALAAAAILILVAYVAVTTNRTTTAHDEVAQSSETTQKEAGKNQEREVRYSYEAQPGDSYSQLARKAVQTYGIVNDVALSQAQIIAAETQLTVAAGSPELEVGQKIELKPADVKAAVEAAQKLSAEAQAAWQPYVAGVDFNTDSIGE